MKRVLAIVLVLAMWVSMSGCSALDYMKASRLYKNGEYEQAWELYAGLDAFADSAKMADICRQKADYEAAEAFLAEGAYEQALPLYEGLGMYADSPLKAITCRYENGLRYLEQGDYKNAIFWLEPLGNYENSTDRAGFARWQWLREETRTHIIRAVTGDSLIMTLEPAEEDTIRLVLDREGHLLGLPYDTRFEMTLVRGEQTAAYQVSCRSESGMIIEEWAEGQVELKALAVGNPLQVSAFSQTVVSAEGEQTESDQLSDGIIVRTVLAESVQQINEYLPILLENTGMNITAAHLGF
jgi:tetratricopeptide (TPR) repeat protein